MKKYILILAALMICGVSGYSQTKKENTPLSFTQQITNEEIDLVILPQLDMENVKAEDIKAETNGEMHSISRVIYTDLDMDNAGTWTELEDGSKIWQLSITSKGALALRTIFNDFHLPYGSKLYAYNKARDQVAGPFTSSDNTVSGIFTSSLIQGDEITLEYFEPAEVLSEAIINISKLDYVYRDYNTGSNSKGSYNPTSWPCHLNVNCEEGDDWQPQKKGVVRIYLHNGINGGWCTGSLINNTNEDCYPYVLFAQHCIKLTGGWAVDEDLELWDFYFDYEFDSCENDTIAPDIFSGTVTKGCRLVSDALYDGESDFILVSLKKHMNHLDPYYNGWDRSGTPSPSGVCIHHPGGDVKKISTYTTPLRTNIPKEWEPMTSSSGWAVKWAATTNGHSITEPGSSGSPIFNNEGRIVGTLSGGYSECDLTDTIDVYGKFSYHWDKNSSKAENQLKPWLDPAGTGVTYLDGRSCLEPPTVIDFIANKTAINPGEVIAFTSTSIVPAKQKVDYIWTLEGANKYSSTSTSTKSAKFDTIGIFDITLEVRTLHDTVYLTKEDYINVGNVSVNELTRESINIYPNPTSDIIYLDLNSELGENINISVYDVYGRLVNNITELSVSTKQRSLDFTTQAQGVYYIHITSEKTNIIEQVSIIR